MLFLCRILNIRTETRDKLWMCFGAHQPDIPWLGAWSNNPSMDPLSRHYHNTITTLSQHCHNAGDEGKKKLLLSKYLTLPHLLDTHLTSIFIFKIFDMCPPTFPLCSDWWITKVYSANVHKTSPVLHQLREVLTQCEISHLGGGGGQDKTGSFSHFYIFSRESDSTITNVRPSVSQSVSHKAKHPNSLKLSSLIFHPSSFILHPSSFHPHFATFKLFSLLYKIKCYEPEH